MTSTFLITQTRQLVIYKVITGDKTLMITRQELDNNQSAQRGDNLWSE